MPDTEDFYCDEVLSGNTPVEKVFETDNVLAYRHTRPFWRHPPSSDSATICGTSQYSHTTL